MKVLTIVFLLSFQLFAQQIYTMQDLKILASQKEYTEYLKHAKDITPSNRNKAWKSLTLNVGISYLNTISKSSADHLTIKAQKLISDISKWPLFRTDEAFKISKRPLIVKIFNQCLASNSNVSECLLTTKNMYSKDMDPELGIKIVKVLNSKRPMSFNPDELISLIRPMLASNICIYYINKSPLKELLTSLSSKSNDIYIQNKVDKDCRKEISKKIYKRLYETNNNLTRKSDKVLLRKWGLLHSNDIYFYNVAQFLSDYQFPKELILTKWKTFRTLGKNQKLRHIILEKLLKKRPLYGKILYNKSNESNAVISAVKRYIPEYFVQYAKLCISYFKGASPSPSSDCHQLFKRSKKLELFSDEKQLQYDKIMSSWKKSN